MKNVISFFIFIILSLSFAKAYYPYSPYVYCKSNPVNFTDPTGMIVIAQGKDEQDMIKYTLPQEAYDYLKFDETGVLDASALSMYVNEVGSQNLSDLLEMASSGDYTFEVYISDTVDYINDKGELETTNMNDIYISQDESLIMTGETGWIGHCGLPGLQRDLNSTNGNVQITINSNLSIDGRAQSLSHELYGHGYMYMFSGGNHSMTLHAPIQGQKDVNVILNNKINRAINETIKNMQR